MADTPEVAAAPAAALPADHPIHRMGDSLYMRAARCRRTEQVPVWFQRQAGRSLPEYRALRGQGSILDAIADPATAAEITLQPVRRYGVDAAVLFSDIVVPAAAVGRGHVTMPQDQADRSRDSCTAHLPQQYVLHLNWRQNGR